MATNKNDVNYTSLAVQAHALHTVGVGRIALTLAANVVVVTDATKPELRTTGNTVCHLTGKLKVSTGAADMALVTFPSGYLPHNVGEYPCIKETSGGTKTTEVLTMSATQLLADGTPGTDDIYHLDSVTYLATY